MTTRRPSSRGVLLSVAAAGLVLTGCEAPSPYVTVVSGDTVVKSEAVSYCFDDQTPDAGNCRNEDNPVQTLQLAADGAIGIDVAKDLADSGWFAVVNDQRLPVQNEHWQRLQLPGNVFDEQGRAQLQIFKVEGDRNDAAWQFILQAPR